MKSDTTTLQYHFFKRAIFLLFLPLCVLFCACGNLPTETPPDSAYVSGIPSPTPSFSEFTTGIFIEEVSLDTISLHYSLSSPENYGITEIPITLGSVSDVVTPDENLADLYAGLMNYDRSSLNEEERLTYDALERYLNLAMADVYSPYLAELLGPVTGFQAQLPILLAEYRFNDVQDVKQYLALLSCVYDYFEEIAAFEKEKSKNGYFMTDETASEIIAQCEEFIKNPDENFLLSTFEERLNALSLPLSEKTEYLMQNQSALYSSVIPAYELLIEALTECLGTGKNEYGMCYFDGGRDYYALLTKNATGSDKEINEIKKCLLEAIDNACLTIATALSKNPALYSEAMHPTFSETDPEEILQSVVLSSETEFPVIDCGDYEIKYIPEALQDYVSPAMYLTPPLDGYESNVIYINPNPLYDADTLFPTVVHEGYPGHLYQTVSCLSNDINPLRFLLAPTGYEEGWATYVEHYCYRYAGLSDPLCTFLQADQTATLCLYALCDILIHYDGYTPEDLAALLSVYGFPRETSDIIYQTLIAEPGAYLPYAVGFLEFLELRNNAKELWGDTYSDYRFHSFLIETGPLPFSLLQEQLMQKTR